MIVGKRFPLLLFVMTMIVSTVASFVEEVEEEKRPAKDLEYTDDEQLYCHNVDIRNNLERLEKIKNCTVITGFLQLVLLEKITRRDIEEYRFEKLR